MDPDSSFAATAVHDVVGRVREMSGSLSEHDADLAGLPDALHAPLRSVASGLPVERHADAVRTLASYCGELEVIAEAVLALDDRERELDAQVAWWTERIAQLDAQRHGPAAGTAADHGVAREISLFRGRIQGAQSMRRHYAHEREGLAARYELAHQRCGDALEALLA